MFRKEVISEVFCEDARRKQAPLLAALENVQAGVFILEKRPFFHRDYKLAEDNQRHLVLSDRHLGNHCTWSC